MAKHLTQDDVRRVAQLLQSWKFKLTWDLLVEACNKTYDLKTTRQALSRNKQIKEEFGIRKRSLKTGVEHSPRPNDINTAHARIERLLGRVKELEQQNERYRETFIRWQYNAESRGVTKNQLEAPMVAPSFGSEKNI